MAVIEVKKHLGSSDGVFEVYFDKSVLGSLKIPTRQVLLRAKDELHAWQKGTAWEAEGQYDDYDEWVRSERENGHGMA